MGFDDSDSLGPEDADTAAPLPPAIADPTLDAIVEKYIALRDKKAALKKAYEASVANIDVGLDRCEAFFKGKMQTLGLTALPTRFGTPYRSSKTSAPVGDWPLFLAWAIEHQRFDMLERRVNKTAVEAFKDEHQDLPPGIGWREEYSVTVRRA